MINIPKGTKDVLPSESYKWQYVEGVARDVAKLFNLKEIRTPVFEHTELFNRSVGDTTDVVTKEMYTFKDKGDRSITLKPEGTAGAGISTPDCSITISNLSMPAAKPTAGVGLPPSCSIKPSYLPPPHTVPCAPIDVDTNSNTVRV